MKKILSKTAKCPFKYVLLNILYCNTKLDPLNTNLKHYTPFTLYRVKTFSQL